MFQRNRLIFIVCDVALKNITTAQANGRMGKMVNTTFKMKKLIKTTNVCIFSEWKTPGVQPGEQSGHTAWSGPSGGWRCGVLSGGDPLRK